MLKHFGPNHPEKPEKSQRYKEEKAMLNHISPVFSPELLAAVYAMGHGDTIVLADGNFPSDGVSRRGAAEIIRADGHGIPELLDAILALMPLDTYAEKPVLYMAKSECDRDLALPILDEYKKIIEKYDERGEACTGYLERYAFYDKAEQACYIVQSGETSQYANIILQKGVVKRNK